VEVPVVLKIQRDKLIFLKREVLIERNEGVGVQVEETVVKMEENNL
jgi:hypothetical protein